MIDGLFDKENKKEDNEELIDEIFTIMEEIQINPSH